MPLCPAMYIFESFSTYEFAKLLSFKLIKDAQLIRFDYSFTELE